MGAGASKPESSRILDNRGAWQAAPELGMGPNGKDVGKQFMVLGDMHKPAIPPPSEGNRQQCLCDTGILDSDHEERFDDITQLLSRIFRAPIALVSIVDSDRQWFKSVVGLPVRQTTRDFSFCAWTLVNHVAQVLLVPNSLKDARFANNPLATGEPHVIFYCGSPIIAKSGHRLGSLCIIDKIPRMVSPEACVFLANMADLVAREIEDPRGQVNNTTAVMLLDTSTKNMSSLYVNSMWQELCDTPKAEAVNKSLSELFQVPGEELDIAYKAAKSGQDYHVTAKSAKTKKCFKLSFCGPFNEILFDDTYIVGAPLIPDSNEELKDINKDLVFVVVSPSQEFDTPSNQWFAMISKRAPTDIKLGMPIGKGSYATVYRGIWSGIEVAVKVMSSTAAIGEDTYNPKNEADIMASLSHPNLVPVYHTAEHQLADGSSELWMCQEMCNMGTMAQNFLNGYFRERSRGWALNMQKVLRAAYQVASAMAYVHSRNIIHSDLTANNILMQFHATEGFIAKVADFGIAQNLAPGEEYIVTEMHGTVTHMAPELLMDCKLSKQADVYSFGILLWELFHCERAFDGMIHAQIIANVALKDARPAVSADLPTDYRTMMEDCWSSDEDSRPTFKQLVERLAAMVEIYA
mmetsp:Transcript_15843/g.44327  ORF Transcript_15843/g.44327 Transcript_15843/m.44327 type:complete len:634 (-) Transcript_15843:108-2009(-)